MILSETFQDALTFAARLHATQTRKGTDIPYISHLLGVASLVLEHGGNETEAIGGLLHDAIEDQAEHYPGGSQALRDEITARFGSAVTDIVVACSDSDGIEKMDWRERKEAYVAHLATAALSTLHVHVLTNCTTHVPSWLICGPTVTHSGTGSRLVGKASGITGRRSRPSRLPVHRLRWSTSWSGQ
ncbi:MAG: HD domain-containing protein [Thiogranum sp.]